MINKIIASLSVNKAILFYKYFKVGVEFHNGQASPFIEV